MRGKAHRTHGFTLVELAIVLVIIGLLFGTVLVARDLIRVSNLRSVTTDQLRYSAAIMAFRDKYQGLPGDITNATDIWGTAAACPGDYENYAMTQATCNGNGNKQIYPAGGLFEHFRAWQQLANAGLVQGSFSGVPYTASANHMLPDFNAPRSKYGPDHGFNLYWYGPRTAADASYFAGDYFNTLSMYRGYASGVNSAGVKPVDQYWIDDKVDDGLPPTGRIRSHESNPNCVTATDSTAQYNTSYDGNACTVIYLLGI